MPPRSQPKVHQIHMRTHKLSIMVTVPPSTTIAALKEEALSALKSPVNQAEGVPAVEDENDFELCRAVKEKGRPNGEYEVLDVTKQVREYSLASYDLLYLQFRDPSGNMLPVTFQSPSVDDEDELPSEVDFPISSASKGKRKAHFDD
ncbi:hypothetical protein D9615_000762 [Tricholomella constricta]|uniref:Uncharacterized protein n=1 Tax=Tricholomella constricta TaxID=117010 RepID=A0A8H5HR42_9AGAR|nr:hypothetical protein D9615_000762 [Tricholomella constricta]